MRRLRMLIVFGILATGIVLPVNATDAESDTANITANIEEELLYLEITAVGDIYDWVLLPESENINTTGIQLTIDFNSENWLVGVDDYDWYYDVNDKQTTYNTYRGFMGSWNGTSYTGTFLMNDILFKAKNSTWESPEWMPSAYNILRDEYGNTPGTYDICVNQTTTSSDVPLETEIYRYVVEFFGEYY